MKSGGFERPLKNRKSLIRFESQMIRFLINLYETVDVNEATRYCKKVNFKEVQYVSSEKTIEKSRGSWEKFQRMWIAK